MDIQLNITSANDAKQKKKKEKSDFSFVKKPSSSGTIIAKPKIHGISKERKINLPALKKSFLNIRNMSTKTIHSNLDTKNDTVLKKVSQPLKKLDRNDGKLQKKHLDMQSEKSISNQDPPFIDSDLQMNFVSRPIKKTGHKKKHTENKNQFENFNSTNDSSKYPQKRNFFHGNKHVETGDDLQLNFESQPKKNFARKSPHIDSQSSHDDNIIDNVHSPQKRNFTRSERHSEPFRKSNKVSAASLFRNNPEIPIVGQRAVLPLSEKLFSGELFTDLNIHSHQLANLEQNLGLKELTTVQQRATPIILQGRDTLVRSQTGSGKTLAYALPIIEALQAIRPKVNRSEGIKVLVIVPTRELATQTYELFIKLVKPFIWIVCGVLSGGQKRKAEKAHLRKGITILVATPGRLRDHLVHTRSLQFENVRCLVLDEADRLLDMGYEKDVSAVIKAMEDHKKAAKYKPLDIIKKSLGKFEEPVNSTISANEVAKHNLTSIFKSEERQTILLSATLTKAVEKLAGLTMVEPVFVDALEGRKPLIADSLTTRPVIKIEETPSPLDKSNKPARALIKTEDKSDSSDSSDGSSDESSNSENIKSVESDDNDVKNSDCDNSISDKSSNDDESSDDDNSKDAKNSDSGNNTSDNNDDKSSADDDDDKSSDDDSDIELLGLKPWNGHQQRNLLDLPEVATELNKDDTNDANNDDSEKNSISQMESECSGIEPRNGPQHSQPLNLPKVNKKKKKIKSAGQEVTFKSTENSDSDSDYEFFKAQKKSADIESKKVKTETNEDSDESTGNSFRDAIKQAIDDQDLVIPESVDQIFIVIPMKLRLVTLTSLIVDECLVRRKNGKILIFMATQELVDFHSKLFERVLTTIDEDGETDSDLIFPVELNFFQLHGSMEHPTRVKVFKQFRDAKSGVLICTDVAARGLDLPQVDTVIQYTIPSSAADYVHRVGRTGRAGKPGRAILVLLPEEVPLLTVLADRRIRIRQEDGELLLRVLSRKSVPFAPGKAAFCSQADRERVARLHNVFEDLVNSEDGWTKSASKAFASWSRQYRTYPRSIRSLVGKLHLGHACRALAIKEAPRDAAAKAKAAIESQEDIKLSQRLRFDESEDISKKQKSRKQFKKTLDNFPLPKRREFSEFDSGLEPIPKKKKSIF